MYKVVSSLLVMSSMVVGSSTYKCDVVGVFFNGTVTEVHNRTTTIVYSEEVMLLGGRVYIYESTYHSKTADAFDVYRGSQGIITQGIGDKSSNIGIHTNDGNVIVLDCKEDGR